MPCDFHLGIESHLRQIENSCNVDDCIAYCKKANTD